jgi:hypothetical protein
MNILYRGRHMKIKRAVLGFLLFFAGSTAFSAYRYYLPQVAIGSFGTGGFRTSFLFFNNHIVSTNVTLTLTDDDGNPMAVTIPGLGTNSTFAFALATGESRIYQTDVAGAKGALKAGAATVTSDTEIGVSGLFTIYDVQGNFTTEAGVGSSAPLNRFALPVQISTTYNTGLALFNPNTTESAITATLTNADGTVSGNAEFKLGAGKHKGVYVTDLFKDVSNFQGMLTVQSSAAISAMTLRQISSPLTYTSCPVVSTALTQKTFNLAQVVNGTSSGVGYKTAFMLFNFSSGAAGATLTLTKDDGTPFPVIIPGQSASAKSSFIFILGAGQSLFLQTDGMGALSQGAAVITADVPIGAASIFTQFDGKGSFATEAGVQSSPALMDLTLPIDSRLPDADTGIAIFNPGASAVALTPRFLDSDGAVTPATAPITIPANGHYAGFFGNMFQGLGSVQGSLAISSSMPISVLTMRENMSPFAMTSLPVAEGSASRPDPAIGDPVPFTLSGISITANTALNRALRPGFHLSGSIKGGVYPYAVTAQSGSRTYTDNPGFFPASYDIVLSPGIYTLKATVATSISGSSDGTFITYTHPTQVAVTNNTTLDITITPPSLFAISGTVSGINKIPGSSSTLRLAMVSTDNTVIGYGSVTNGNYHTSLPAGDYIIGVMAASVPSGGFNEDIGFFNIGLIHVSGNMTQNLAIPDLATLSGTASFPGSMPAQATITAIDSSSSSDFSLISRTSTWPALSGFNGAYQMLLAKDRAYTLAISYPLSGGNVQFPLTANAVDVAGDSRYNFAIPALPGEVQLSGKVTDYTGKGLSGVAVAAVAESLIGALNAGFATTGTTDSNGNYAIKVLSGRYQLTFTPPSLP